MVIDTKLNKNECVLALVKISINEAKRSEVSLRRFKY